MQGAQGIVGIDLHDLPGQAPDHIHEMRGLLHQLAAGLGHDLPPRRRRHASPAVGRHHRDGAPPQKLLRPIHRLEITELVPHAGEHPGPLDGPVYFQRLLERERHGLFHEQMHPFFGGDQFRIRVRKRRHADIKCIHLHLIQHRAMIRISLRFVLSSPLHGALLHHIADGHDLSALDPVDLFHMPAGIIARSDKAHLYVVHHDLPVR